MPYWPVVNSGAATALAAKGKYTGVAIKVTGLPKTVKAPLRITKKVKKRTKTVRRVKTSGKRVRLAPGKYQLVTPSFNHQGGGLPVISCVGVLPGAREEDRQGDRGLPEAF